MMGFAWGAGALMTTIAGAMSEKFGFARALMIAAVVPLASAALLWFYPKDEQTSAARAREALAVAD
jgi:MFS family permease